MHAASDTLPAIQAGKVFAQQEVVTHCLGCRCEIRTTVLRSRRQAEAPAPKLWCDTCFAAQVKRGQDEAQAARTHQRTQAYELLCPPVYRDTNVDRLPCARASVEAVALWAKLCPTLGPRNAPSDVRAALLLHGPTRTGKTRLALLALKHLVAARGCGARLYLPGDFAREIADAYRHGEERGLWHTLTTVEVLMLDDLGKEKLTDRVEAFLFELLENRFSWRRCTILTTNHTGDDLASRFFEPERGAALVARLREFCQAVQVMEKGAA